ncbi:MAG: ABC transporter permease [Crocinitomicaceae bacterium]|nr:ABC transporter permease [Crocinitomicaceae bacterium]
MKTLLKISWRNCWKSPLRTGIVIGSIIVGIWSSIFMMGFMDGMMTSRKNNVINTRLGHIQIHSPEYEYDPNILNSVKDREKVIQALENNPHVVGYTDRFVTEGVLKTAREQRGIKINGIDVEKDAATLLISEKADQGSFFGEEFKYPVAVGDKLAKELKLEIGSKVSLSLTKPDSTQTSKNFKVAAIYKSGDAAYDNYNIFVPKEAIYKVIKSDEPIVHEIIVKIDDIEKADEVKAELLKSIKSDEVLTWLEADPYSAYAEDSYGMMMFILMTVIIVALLFGILNTVIMSVLERKREIGVLRSIGMTKKKVWAMITLESLIFGLVGGPLGILTGWATTAYFGKYGFDLSSYGEAMEAYGLDTIVYFNIPVEYYFIYSFLIVIATVIGSLIPAYIATRVNPIEAIRSI